MSFCGEAGSLRDTHFQMAPYPTFRMDAHCPLSHHEINSVLQYFGKCKFPESKAPAMPSAQADIDTDRICLIASWGPGNGS
jgi:hypothetical protein